jgi:hypothetical protein
MFDPKFWLLDKPGEDKVGRESFPNFYNCRWTVLIKGDRSVDKVFSFIITYFNKKVNFNL